MQIPVPQFTDVEDKIIGPLTLKQFGIIFGAGIIVVLVYTGTKSLLITIPFVILLGLPALGIAFAKINGRPIYNLFPVILAYFSSEKDLIFHKGSSSFTKKAEADQKQENQKAARAKEALIITPKTSLEEVNKLLAQEAQEEAEMFKKLK